jgi:hypothetical protein
MVCRGLDVPAVDYGDYADPNYLFQAGEILTTMYWLAEFRAGFLRHNCVLHFDYVTVGAYIGNPCP